MPYNCRAAILTNIAGCVFFAMEWLAEALDRRPGVN
jgi:hypothetical protein